MNIGVQVFSVNITPHFSKINTHDRDCWVIGYVYISLYKKLINYFLKWLNHFTFLASTMALLIFLIFVILYVCNM